MKKLFLIGALGLMMLTACSDIDSSSNDNKCTKKDNSGCSHSTVVVRHTSTKTNTSDDESHTSATVHESAPVEVHPVESVHVSVAR